MTWRAVDERDVRTAAVAVLVAAAVALWSAWNGVRVAPVLPMPPSPAPPERTAEPAQRAAPLDRLIALAPFSPDRRAVPTPAPAAAPATASLAAGALRLVGTVVGDGPPLAVCQLGSARARFLHRGDTLGGWTLQAITPARVTFVDAAGTRHELRLTSPGT